MGGFEPAAARELPRPSYGELLYENGRLRKENKKLIAESEQVREVFRTGLVEFERRNKRIAELTEALNGARETIRRLEAEKEDIARQLQKKDATCNMLNTMVFGRKPEQAKTQESASHRGAVKGHTGHGRKTAGALETREETIDLPEDEKVCATCGKPLRETTMEAESEQVCFQKTYYMKKIKRKIYKKTCTCPHPIVTAKLPAKLIPKGKYSTEFWVEALIAKFKNHLPIQRQVSDMNDCGLRVSSGTICGGFLAIHALYIAPLYAAMGKELRLANHFHADESGWKVFVKLDDKGNYNWFVWVFISKDIVLFVLDPTRSASVAGKALFDLEEAEMDLLETNHYLAPAKKTLSSDKYAVYKMMDRLGLVDVEYCWVHQKREFRTAKTKYPELSDWANEWIKRIALLFHTNNLRKKHPVGSPDFIEHDTALRAILNEMDSLINLTYSHPGQIEVVESMKIHWRGLTLFLRNPNIPMDNNLAERTIRHAVIGRKNYWGNHSVSAADLTAAMFSIVLTCARQGLSARAYLTYYLRECAARGAAPSDIVSFLPHKLPDDIKLKIKTAPV